jgi:hypothetical protein
LKNTKKEESLDGARQRRLNKQLCLYGNETIQEEREDNGRENVFSVQSVPIRYKRELAAYPVPGGNKYRNLALLVCRISKIEAINYAHESRGTQI